MTLRLLLLFLFLTTPVFAESICLTDPPTDTEITLQHLCHDILVVAPAIERQRNQRWAEIDAWHLPPVPNTPPPSTYVPRPFSRTELSLLYLLEATPTGGLIPYTNLGRGWMLIDDALYMPY